MIITLGSELIYLFSKNIDDTMGIHTEVLLPAFVLGCLIMHHKPLADSHAPEAALKKPESSSEKKVSFIISAAFMAPVGLSMPSVLTAELPSDALKISESVYYEESQFQFAQPDPAGEIEDIVTPDGDVKESSV